MQESAALVERSTRQQQSGEDAETAALSVHAKLESLGHDVGYRFIERVAQQRIILPEPLEV